MKAVYLAGPIAAPDAWQRERNIRQAEEISLIIWKMGGVVPICVHSSTRFFDGTLPHEAWMEGDFELIRRVDAIVMLPGWRESKGAMMEYRFAMENGKHVFIWHSGYVASLVASDNKDEEWPTCINYTLREWIDGRDLPAAA